MVEFLKNPATHTIQKLKSRESKKCKLNKTTVIRVLTEKYWNATNNPEVKRYENLVSRHQTFTRDLEKLSQEDLEKLTLNYSQSRKKSITYNLTKKSSNSRDSDEKVE